MTYTNPGQGVFKQPKEGRYGGYQHHSGTPGSFRGLTSGDYANFALFSCFVNGEPASAIVAVNRQAADEYQITPLFVSVTPG
jgi:hypothetical protein